MTSTDGQANPKLINHLERKRRIYNQGKHENDLERGNCNLTLPRRPNYLSYRMLISLPLSEFDVFNYSDLDYIIFTR